MGKKHEDEDESESSGSDLEQTIAMLEKAEIDYDKQASEDDGDNSTELVIDGTVMFSFDDDGNLQSVGAAE